MACAMPILVPSGPSCRDPLSSSAALGRAGLQTMELEEAPDGNPNGTRSASSADHHRLGGYLDRRGLEGARRAGGPRGRAPVPYPVSRPGVGGRVGGDDGLAVRGRGAAPDRSDRASRRAGRHRCVARQQEARQERPRRRQAPTRATDGRQGARVVDCAGPHPRPARARASAPHALRAARRVAAADPVGALSPRMPQARGPDQPSRADVAGRPAAAGVRARAGYGGAGDDRRARAPARAAGQAAAHLRPPPARLQGAASPLRDRRADVGHDPGGARRPQPLLLLHTSRPVLRPGHHRARLRPAPRARPPLPPGTASVALGAVRSRPVRPTAKLTRPRLLRPGRGAARWQPRLPVDRAQTAQAQLPHAARARRGGPATRMTSAVRAKPSFTQMRRGQLPPSSCRHHKVDGHHRPSGRNASPSGITPSTIMSPTRKHPGSWTEIRLGARAHHIPRPDRDRAPPNHPAVQPSNPESRLTSDGCTDKEPSEPCESGALQARGEFRALALAQAAERLAGRDMAALQNLGGLHAPDLGESQHHVEDLRGLQVRGRVEQQRTNRHPAGLELALELRAKRTNLVRPAERVHALIQAALGGHPVLVERALVRDDTRPETTRAPSTPPAWTPAPKARCSGGTPMRSSRSQANPLPSRPPSPPPLRAVFRTNSIDPLVWEYRRRTSPLLSQDGCRRSVIAVPHFVAPELAYQLHRDKATETSQKLKGPATRTFVHSPVVRSTEIRLPPGSCGRRCPASPACSACRRRRRLHRTLPIGTGELVERLVVRWAQRQRPGRSTTRCWPRGPLLSASDALGASTVRCAVQQGLLRAKDRYRQDQPTT